MFKSFSELLPELRRLAGFQNADTSEDGYFLVQWQIIAPEVFVEKGGTIDSTEVVTFTRVTNKWRITSFFFLGIVNLTVAPATSAPYEISNIEQPPELVPVGLPSQYSVSSLPSGVDSTTKEQWVTLHPIGPTWPTLELRGVVKGIYIPTGIGDTTRMTYHSLFDTIITRIISRLAIRRNEGSAELTLKT